MKNIENNAIVLLWVPHWDPNWPTSLCVILRTSGKKIIRPSLNLLCIEDMWMTHFYFFLHMKVYLNKQHTNYFLYIPNGA